MMRLTQSKVLAQLACAGIVLAGATIAEAGDRSVLSGTASARMALGPAVAAPTGFLDFCRRSPAQCREPNLQTDNVEMVQARANELYWAGVFGKSSANAGPAATGRSERGARVDWDRVFRDANTFAQARASASRRDNVARTSPSSAVVPAPLSFVAPAAEDYAVHAVSITDVASSTSIITRRPPVVSHNPMSLVFTSLNRVPAVAPTADAVPDVSQAFPDLMRPLALPDASTFRPFQADHEDASGGRSTAYAVANDVPIVSLDKAGWQLVKSINRTVNRRIRRGSDARTFGVEDFWQAPTEAGARGDCEDYVLAKRADLISAGIPADTLSIAIVTTRWGESHAVLLVATDTGEFVLDNLSPWISRWDQVDYVWQERQAPGRIFDWVRMAS